MFEALGDTQLRKEDFQRLESTVWTSLDIVERCVQRVELLERRIHNLEAKQLREDLKKINDELQKQKPRLVKGKQ
jgi:predicted component of type VI protein secretion system